LDVLPVGGQGGAVGDDVVGEALRIGAGCLEG
jgi:hypothetical protein